MTATFLHRLRRAIRELRDELQPGRRHNIAAARRARLTKQAHAYGDRLREKMRDAR